jgi:hypothetical protein
VAVVLCGFAEALAAIETAWSLQDAGHRVVAFTRRGRRPPLRRCVEMHEVSAPEEDAEACVADVRALVERCGADAVLPLDDLALWVCARAHRPAVLVGAAGERLALALDKRAQVAAAGAAGFAVPETQVLEAARDAGLEPPCVLKPAEAVRERAGRLERPPTAVCGDAAELAAAIARVGPDEPALVQRWLPGVGEGLFALAAGDALSALSAHRRVRMLHPRGAGASACEGAPVDASLAGAATRLLAGWRGLAMVEVLRGDDGTAWFVELNARPWGSMALARRRGLEYPAWAVAQALDPGFVAPAGRPAEDRVRARHVGRELRHLATVLRGPRPPAPLPWPSRRATARAMLRWRGDALYNHRPGALRVLLDDTWQTVRP